MALSTTTSTPTGWAADAAYANYQRAQQIAGRPYTPYTGNMLAGANPNQIAGYSGLSTLGQYGQGALGAGQAAAQAAAGFQPQQVAAGTAATPQGTVMNTPWASAGNAHLGQAFNTAAASAGPAAQMQAAQMARGDVRDVTAKGFTNYNINDYMNPYVNTVVNNSLADLSRQNDIVNNGTNARASAAGAFGGSRQAVANTLNNENYLRESGNLSGNLRHQGFNAASGLIMQDANRDLTAQTSNQGMDWNVGNLNTSNRQQAGYQNMLASNNMSQYNASNQMQANRDTAAAHNARESANVEAINRRAEYNTGNQQRSNELTSGAHNTMTQANMNAQQSGNQFNADLSLRAQLGNQSAYQNAINTTLAGANALNGMGMDQQRWALNNANGQLTAGNAMQQQEQAQLDEQYRRWAEAQGYDRNQLEYLRGALSGAPMGSTQISPYYNNTGANVLAGVLGGAQVGAGILKNGSEIVSGGKALWDWFS